MTWWQRSTLYSLFTLSFQDNDGDGYGDLAGVLRRLDYMKWLGVGAIWLGPIFTTPLIDAGYDIADFEDIDPRFGSIERFDELLAACHEREMKVVMDLAPNHTSDAHPWFRASRSARSDAKRDWYIWRDGRPDGTPPNNWKDAAPRENGMRWPANTTTTASSGVSRT
jgi:glycosidase